jgi:acetate kinase
MRAKGLDADGLERLLDRDSGLLGISGLSNDVRVLRHAPKDDRSAALAIAMFAYAARKAIAGMIAALSGVDLLVFTGGIGEHDARTRDEILVNLAPLGVDLAPNPLPAPIDGIQRISSSASRTQVLVVPAQEDRMIALHVLRLSHANPQQPA